MFLPVGTEDTTIKGRIDDDSGLSQAELDFNSDTQSLPTDGVFSEQVGLRTDGPGPFLSNVGVVRATDLAGNSNELLFRLHVPVPHVAGRVIVRFAPHTGKQEAKQVIDDISGTVLVQPPATILRGERAPLD